MGVPELELKPYQIRTGPYPFSYSVNVRLTGFTSGQWGGIWSQFPPCTLGKAIDPSRKFLVVEEDTRLINDGAWWPPNYGSDLFGFIHPCLLSVRHDRRAEHGQLGFNAGRANVVFLDGHCEFIDRHHSFNPAHVNPLLSRSLTDKNGRENEATWTRAATPTTRSPTGTLKSCELEWPMRRRARRSFCVLFPYAVITRTAASPARPGRRVTNGVHRRPPVTAPAARPCRGSVRRGRGERRPPGRRGRCGRPAPRTGRTRSGGCVIRAFVISLTSLCKRAPAAARAAP